MNLKQEIENCKKSMEIVIYCLDCKEYFTLDQAKWENVWCQCPTCSGQNYTVRRAFK